MQLVKMMNTIYVLDNQQKKSAILKKKHERNLELTSSSIDLELLKEFLNNNGYQIAE